MSANNPALRTNKIYGLKIVKYIYMSFSERVFNNHLTSQHGLRTTKRRSLGVAVVVAHQSEV